MTGRVYVAIGRREWAAAVAGTRVTLSGVTGEFTVHVDPDGQVRVESPDGAWSGIAARAGDVVWVAFGGEMFHVTVAAGPRRPGSTSLDQDALAAPMAATVVRISVQPGHRVRTGDPLIALEAMKMELPIRAPRDGIVKAIHCREGELVPQGAVLIELAHDSDESPG